MSTTYDCDPPHFPDGASGSRLRPGHLLAESVVIACQTWSDTEGRDEQEVIRLMADAPHYEVAVWSFTGHTPSPLPGVVRFHNIADAVKECEA